MLGKKDHPCALEKFDLHSTTERTHLHAPASSEHIAEKVYKAYTMSAANDPVPRKPTVQKNTPILDLSTTEDDLYILIHRLGDATISFRFRKNFTPSGWLLNPEIKVKSKRYLGLLLSFIQEFFCNLLQISRNQELRVGREEKQRS